MSVKDFHKDYDKYSRKWKRCRDVVSGQDAIYAACTKSYDYLPTLIDETALEYKARLMRTPFYNASWRTLAGFVGMMFRKPPTLDAPDKIKELLKDVTLTGVSFDMLAQDTALEDMEVSRVGILVDHPQQVVRADGSRLTVAEAEALNLRPTMQIYKAEAIRNHSRKRINNKTVLAMVRLTEEAEVQRDEFTVEYELRIRILDLDPQGFYRQRLFKEDTEEQIGDDIYPTMNGKKLTEIPFYFIGPDGIEPNYDDPILIDLFDLNIKHFQVSADYEHACHMTALPTPWVTGYTNEPGMDGVVKPAVFRIGSTTAWVFPNADTQVGFLEYQGGGLDALDNNIKGKERQMAAIGARMLAPEKAGTEAAQTLSMRHNGEYSILGGIANAVSAGLTQALNMFAKWAGVETECTFEINRNFVPMGADPATITAWVAAVQAGLLSEASAFELFKKADLIDADIDFEEEQTRIASGNFPRVPNEDDPTKDPLDGTKTPVEEDA